MISNHLRGRGRAGTRAGETLLIPGPGLRLLSAARQGLSCLPSLASLVSGGGAAQA